MMMSQFAKKFTRLGRDGYNLARAVVQHRGSNVKPILLDYARQSNSVATSLLNVDKQVGLIKYYGLSTYIKQRLQSTSALTTAGSGDDDLKASGPSGPPSDGKAAKIAFMVTASMKQELTDLGYDADQVKTLSPLQASLILNHKIGPGEMATKLPIAEAEYEEQRQKDEEEARERAEQQQQEIATVNHQPTASTADLGSGLTQFFGTSHGYGSRNELEEMHNGNIGAFFNTSEWFEITEINSKGQSSRVGLYQDQEEAKLGLETRRDIAQAKNTNQKFEMHRIDWKDLQ